MKKLICLSLLLMLPLLTAMGGTPQTETAPVQMPKILIGVVDTNNVFQQSSIAQDGFALIQEAQIIAQEQINTLEKEINDSDATDEEKDIRRQLELQAAVSFLQGVLEEYQQSVVAEIEKALQEALTSVRTKNDFQMVLSKEVILSYDPTSDVTSAVVAEINARTVTFPALPKLDLDEKVEVKLPEENTAE